MSDDVKLLKNLKVSELKSELEIRDLVTSGVKAVLADRLKNHLEENGLDPETYDFEAKPLKVRIASKSILFIHYK